MELTLKKKHTSTEQEVWQATTHDGYRVTLERTVRLNEYRCNIWKPGKDNEWPVVDRWTSYYNDPKPAVIAGKAILAASREQQPK